MASTWKTGFIDMDLPNKQVGNTYGKYCISLSNPLRLLFPGKKHLQILCLIRVTQLTALSPSKHVGQGTSFSGVILHCVMFLMKLVSRRWLRHHPPQAAPDNPLWFWCLFSSSTKQVVMLLKMDSLHILIHFKVTWRTFAAAFDGDYAPKAGLKSSR